MTWRSKAENEKIISMSTNGTRSMHLFVGQPHKGRTRMGPMLMLAEVLKKRGFSPSIIDLSNISEALLNREHGAAGREARKWMDNDVKPKEDGPLMRTLDAIEEDQGRALVCAFFLAATMPNEGAAFFERLLDFAEARKESKNLEEAAAAPQEKKRKNTL